ncbi:MAG: flagellar hook-basal body complex protein [Lachnospiraceae bacterium]|nr:flagellar hook-basal body complex protein [Lachnospiraceae bacterium]
MMRSLFSGVAGLRTHQTRMDVIGNNIANVNTVAYKSSSMTFQNILYQNTQNASGPNPNTGRAGINPKQIGLGVTTGSIATSITQGGAVENTGNPFDIKINGNSFFIVSDGVSASNYYTRAGAFNVDADGTLCMSTNGYVVMGYGTMETGDGEAKTTEIDTSQLKKLTIMSEANSNSPASKTVKSYMTGILDAESPALNTAKGQIVTVPFYDSKGYSYTAQYSIKPGVTTEDPPGAGKSGYSVTITDIFDSDGKTIFVKADGTEMSTEEKIDALAAAGDLKPTKVSTGTPPVISMGASTKVITFDKNTGKLTFPEPDPTTKEQNLTITMGGLNPYFKGEMDNMTMDLSTLINVGHNGNSTISGGKGTVDSTEGAGWPVGELSNISIAVDGQITGTYTNGQSKLLGQIAVATFSNAAGLNKEGDNLYTATMNSGDAIVGDITADGGSMNTGQLEMSNVDLSQEFTTMITTQRGFQANSRMITGSDTMLEDRVNLKR